MSEVSRRGVLRRACLLPVCQVERWPVQSRVTELVATLRERGVRLSHVDQGPPAKAFWAAPAPDAPADDQQYYEELGVISTEYARAVSRGLRTSLWLRKRQHDDYATQLFLEYSPENVIATGVTEPEPHYLTLEQAKDKLPNIEVWK